MAWRYEVPGKPVAYKFGPLSVNCLPLWGIVWSYCFGLLHFPGRYRENKDVLT